MNQSPVVNPFKYGSIVFDEYFCSRPHLEKQLAAFIRSGQNVLIEGERRTGKTSLIYQTARSMKSYRLLYIDLFEIKTVDDFCRRVINALVTIEHRSGFFESMITTLAHLRPKLTLDPVTGVPVVSIDATADIKPSSIEGLMEFIYSHYRKRRAIVVFDEFQDILQLKDSRTVLALLRSKIQFQPEIPYIFAGSVRNAMHEIFYNPDSPFFKSAASITVGSIDQMRFINFITDRFQQRGRRKIPTDTIAAVFAITQEVPGDVQEMCAALWDTTPPQKTITPDHIPAALELIYSREQKVYENYLGMITGQQLRCLVSLARLHGRAPYSSEFINDSGIQQPGSIRKALARLLQLRIVYLSNREYKFVNPFFRAWLLQKRY
jgi:hypothetical protein